MNCTIVYVDHVTGTSTWGAHLRRGTDAQIYNSIFIGWKSPGLYVQDNATAARGFYPQPSVWCGPSSSVGDEGGMPDLDVRTLNPVSNQAMFFVRGAQSGPTKVDVFDTQRSGAFIPPNRVSGAERRQFSWNPGRGMSAGTYFYRVENGGRTATGRLVIVR